MPLINEYACRLASPDRFKRFARMEREHDGKKYSVIIGWPGAGSEGSEDQSLRYHKDIWTEAAARSHCKEKKGTFETIKKEEGTDLQEDAICGDRDLPLDDSYEWDGAAAEQRTSNCSVNR